MSPALQSRTIGAALFAALSAFGHNIRKILAHTKSWLGWSVVANLKSSCRWIAKISQSRPPEWIVQVRPS
ncbi:hypothetical protein, partial [Aphanothece microscopica]|uniref:hypothetical protein n=1 Tax=Aphanothece microscopica TaxID=1049561 RepID=UPI003984ADA9